MEHGKTNNQRLPNKIIYLCTVFLAVSSQVFGNVIFVSDREQFYDAEDLSTHQAKKKIFLEPPFKFGVIDEKDWINVIHKKKAVVIIHGYNNDFEDAIDFSFKIIKGTKDLYDSFICYFWPGYDDFWEYLMARSMTTQTRLPNRLLSLIEDLSHHTTQVDVISFSMGCRLALEALKRAKDPLVHNLFLLAPAVDNESLESGAVYSEAANKPQKTFVFHSKNDGVLSWAYPIIEWDQPLGSKGSESLEKLSSKIYMINSSAHVKDHQDYPESNFIFKIISNVVRGSETKKL